MTKKRNGRRPEKNGGGFKTRYVKNGFPGREFDVEFWQEQGDEAIFRAAWEMIRFTEHSKHGRQPAFQRTVTNFKRS
jgi:hypothetical protein